MLCAAFMPNYNVYYSEFRKAYSRTSTQGVANTRYIIYHLMQKGWKYGAVCGLLGNIQAESALNPNRPEETSYTVNGTKYPSSDWFPSNVAHGVTRGRYGFGLCQWTPWWKAYTSDFPGEQNGDGMGHPTFKYWCIHVYGTGEPNRTDSNPIGQMPPQIEYIDTVPWGYSIFKKWQSAGYIFNYSFSAFKQIDSPEEAAGAWLFNYERPGSVSSSSATVSGMKKTLTARQNNARWYYDTYADEFGGTLPPQPIETKILKGGKNVWRILHLIQR